MKTIKKIDILSIAKIFGMVSGGIYLVAGVVVNLAVLVFKIPIDKRFDILGFGSGILATFMVALLVGAVIFTVGAIIGWLYNVTAKLIGGIHVQIEDLPEHRYQFFYFLKGRPKKNLPLEPSFVSAPSTVITPEDKPITADKSDSIFENQKPPAEANSIIDEKERDSFTV